MYTRLAAIALLAIGLHYGEARLNNDNVPKATTIERSR